MLQLEDFTATNGLGSVEDTVQAFQAFEKGSGQPSIVHIVDDPVETIHDVPDVLVHNEAARTSPTVIPALSHPAQHQTDSSQAAKQNQSIARDLDTGMEADAWTAGGIGEVHTGEALGA